MRGKFGSAFQSGAALIMVLLISAVLGVLVTLTAYKSRLLVMQGHLIGNSITAQQAVDDVAAELVFKLTTSSVWLLGPKASRLKSAGLPSDLNFYGSSFAMGDVSVRIQDLSGLISIIPFDEDGFKRLLKQQGIETEAINVATDSLLDWMDTDDFKRINGAERASYDNPDFPRNGFVQSLYELKEVSGVDEAMFSSFSSWVTLFGYGGVVDKFSPSTLLKALKSKESSDNIIKRRERESSLESSLEGNPSRRLKVSLSSTYELGSYSKSFILVRGMGTREPFFFAEYSVGE